MSPPNFLPLHKAIELVVVLASNTTGIEVKLEEVFSFMHTNNLITFQEKKKL